MKLVYVAGPISTNPMHHTHHAAKIAAALMDAGFVVYTPHATVLLDMIVPRDYEEWMAVDFELIRRSDALFRIGGISPGADREVMFAKEQGIPVFHTIKEVVEWAS